MRTLFINNFLVAGILILLSEMPLKAQSQLDAYIEEGLANNLVLQQKTIGLEKAMNALSIAKGMFLPSVNLMGSYTSGDGGRNIAFPVGDLLNPVYSTLNRLTDSNQFPQIENVNTNFFPRDFYDAKVRTSVPIFNSDLIYNQKIKQQQVVLQEYEQDIYKRELIRNIKTAYFNYFSALEAIRIYQSAFERALEGKRVNESLLSNGKGLAAYILRAQSEIENVKAQLLSNEKQAENAQLYFNFLLNRDAEAEIIKSDIQLPDVLAQLAENTSAVQREELRQVNQSITLTQTVLKMNKLFSSPKLSGFLDLGAQAEHWNFNSQAKYYLVGVQLDVPLFAGFTNRHKIRQSALDVKNASLNLAFVNRQLDMSAKISQNNLAASYQDYQSAQMQLEAAQSYQRLIDKGYKEGVNTFIETVDARTQLTSAQLLVAINQYKVLIAEANYEREIAAYPIHN